MPCALDRILKHDSDCRLICACPECPCSHEQLENKWMTKRKKKKDGGGSVARLCSAAQNAEMLPLCSPILSDPLPLRCQSLFDSSSRISINDFHRARRDSWAGGFIDGGTQRRCYLSGRDATPFAANVQEATYRRMLLLTKLAV